MKRTLSIILVLSVLLAVFPVTASAETYSGTCGSNLTWKLDTDTSVLTISGKGDMSNYSSGTAPWYNYRDNIKTVVLKEGVTSIGAYAFDHSAVTSVEFPSTLTTIKHRAFAYCWGLEYITIPETITLIEEGAFCDTNNLEGIIVDSGNRNYLDIDGILFDKSIETILVYPSNKAGASYAIPATVKRIAGYAFVGCKLTKLSIPEGVTSIGKTCFYGSNGLTYLRIPDSVTKIESWAFAYCSNLERIMVPVGVKRIEMHTYEKCDSLMDIYYRGTVEQWNKISFYSYNDPFYNAKLHYNSDYNMDLSTCNPNPALEFEYNGNRYAIFDYYLKWNKANEVCEDLFGHLVTFEDSAEYDYVLNQAAAFGKEQYWIGYTDEKQEGNWKWVTGEPNKYANWSTREPNDYGEGEDYAAMVIESKSWNDLGSETKCRFICEWDHTGDVAHQGKYVIIVQNSKGEPLKGVSVSWNTETAVTLENGMVFFDKETVGEPVIAAAKNGYIPYSNENTNYQKSDRGYDIITLYTIEEGACKLSSAYYIVDDKKTDILSGTKRLSLSVSSNFSLECKATDNTAVNYKLMQGNTVVAESADGRFLDLNTRDFSADEQISVTVTNTSGVISKTPINLQFVNDKSIDGTGLKLGGENLSFAVDEGVPFLGGSQLNFDIPNTPIDVYVSDDTVHLGINFDIPKGDDDACEKKIEKIKGLIGTIQHMQKTETSSGHSIGNTMQAEINFLMKDKNLKAKWGPVSTNLNFIGYGEGKFDENGLAKVKVYLCLTGSVSAKLQGPTFVVVLVPVTYSVTISAKGEVAAEISYDLNTQTANGDLALTITPGLEAFGGVGIGNAVGAGAYGSAKMPFEFQLLGTSITPGLNYVDLTGELGLKAYLGPFAYEHSFAHNTWHLYTRTGYSKQTAMMLRSAPESIDLTDEMQYRLEDLSYLADQSDWLGYAGGVSLFYAASNTAVANQLTPLQIGTYRNMRPAIGVAGETPVMVWVTANTDRNDCNYPQLVYSVYENGLWCDPMPVDDNDTLDSAHTLYTAEDGTLWLAYQDTKDGWNTTNLEDYAANQTVRVARFDEISGGFTDFVTLSEPDVFSRMPVITEQDGTTTALWVANTDNSYFGENTTNTLCYAQYENGTWHDAQVLASDLNAVTETAIGSCSGVLSAAAITDEDNDLTTTDDRVLWLYDDFGQAQKVATGSVSAATFAMLPDRQASDLLWSDGKSLVAHDKGTVLENPALSGGFTVLSDRILYNSADGEDSSNLFVQIYENGTWTAPVRVTVQDQYLQSYTAAEIAGQIYLSAVQATVDITVDTVNETCTLAWAALSGRTDAAITAVDVDYSAEAAGAIVPVYVDVSNLGDTTLSQYTITVGTAASRSVSTALSPGETTTVELAVPLGETAITTDYTVMVTAENDADADNNTSEITIGYSDLAVSTEVLQTGDNRTVLIKVANEGIVPSGGTLSVASEIDSIQTLTVDTLKPGEFSIYRVDISSELIKNVKGRLVTATVMPDATEWNQLNDQSTSYVEALHPIAKFDIAGANMTLGNDLKMNFMIKKSDMKDGYVAKVSQAGGEPVELELWDYNSQYYAASYSVAAKEMSDVLSVEIYDADGYLVSDPFTRTVQQYAMTLLNNASQPDSLKRVIVDMLNYGTQAQRYFGYNELAYANADVTAEQQAAYATADVDVTNNQVAGTNFVGANLSLEDSILLNVFFKGITDGDVTGITATVSFTDYLGTEVIADAEVSAQGTSMVKVVVNRIVLADAGRPVTVTVYKDGVELGSGVESVESYIARNLSNTSTAEINMAIMKFAASAYDHLGGTN